MVCADDVIMTTSTPRSCHISAMLLWCHFPCGSHVICHVAATSWATCLPCHEPCGCHSSATWQPRHLPCGNPTMSPATSSSTSAANSSLLVMWQVNPWLWDMGTPGWRTDTVNQRGGSKLEPIKILLEGDGDSNKMNTASNTRLWLATQVSQAHSATRVLLDLGTNSLPHRPENVAEHKTRASLTYTGQAGEHHRSDRSLLVKTGDFHRTALHRSSRCNTPVRPVSARKPQNTKQAYQAPNWPKLETAATQNNSEHTQTFTQAKTQQGLAPVRPVRGTG
jgi:hypothetical protein